MQMETMADQAGTFEPETFERWSELYLGGYLGAPFDPALWFIAEESGEPAGICLCRPEWGADRTLGWVNVVGVRRPWRRQGLGLALLLHAFGELYQRGIERVGLGVHGENPTGAPRAVRTRRDVRDQALRPLRQAPRLLAGVSRLLDAGERHVGARDWSARQRIAEPRSHAQGGRDVHRNSQPQSGCAAVLTAVAAIAAGSAVAAPTPGAGRFMTEIVRQKIDGEYAQAWESLYPAHQRVAPRDAYVACESLVPSTGSLVGVRAMRVFSSGSG